MQSYISSVPEKVEIKDKVYKPREFIAEKKELSDNIKKFDNKKRTPSPYDYNSVSLKKTISRNKPLSEIISDPLYSSAAKVLGITNVHDWERDYDKIEYIVDWAKDKTKLKDNDRLISWIYDQVGKSPTVSNRRLDDLFVYAKMGGKGFTPLTKTKVVEKVVKVQPKEESVSQSVDRFLKGILNVN